MGLPDRRFWSYFEPSPTARLLNEFRKKGNCSVQWTPMDLRHSYAVNFLKAGGDIRKLQYTLGHENLFDTRRLYAEVVAQPEILEVKNPFEIGS